LEVSPDQPGGDPSVPSKRGRIERISQPLGGTFQPGIDRLQGRNFCRRRGGVSQPLAGAAVAPRASFAQIVTQFGKTFDAMAALPPGTVLHAGRPGMSLPLYLGHRFHELQRSDQ
jgi:hypothetical protein